MTQEAPLILVVDDSIDICMMVKLALSKKQYRVELAHSGEEAIQKIVELRPSLVLLDVVMPNLSGLEVLSKIRASDDFKNLPIILMSARTQDSDIRRARALGASEYVTKPFNLNQLLKLIDGYLSGTTQPEKIARNDPS